MSSTPSSRCCSRNRVEGRLRRKCICETELVVSPVGGHPNMAWTCLGPASLWIRPGGPCRPPYHGTLWPTEPASNPDSGTHACPLPMCSLRQVLLCPDPAVSKHTQTLLSLIAQKPSQPHVPTALTPFPGWTPRLCLYDNVMNMQSCYMGPLGG